MSFTKEEEIRPRDIFKELLYWVEQDAYALLEQGDFEKVLCPACNSRSFEKQFEKHQYSIVECCDCSSLYVNPRPTKQSLNDFFSHSRSAKFFVDVFYPAVEEDRKKKLIPERAEKLLAFAQKKDLKKGTIVDVGAGQGFYLDAVGKIMPDFELRAIEPNQEFAQLCKKKNYKTLASVVEDNTQWEAVADIVTCFEVFEHVHNPKDFVLALKKMLKPGGCLLITSLSGDGFDIRLLKDQSDIVAPPQHLNFISIQGYKTLFEDLGFQSVEIITPGKLDVNIVNNKIAEHPGYFKDAFVNYILQQDEDIKQKFQTFLVDNLLSSHVWVFAINQ